MTDSLLVVIPAFNEAATISSVVTKAKELRYNVLVVDDGSNDATAERAAAAGAEVLQLPINLGVGGALRAGFRFAVDQGYTSVVQIDADGQHPVHQISDLRLAANQHDAHLVIGSRYLSHEATLAPAKMRRVAMWLLGKIASRSAGRVLTDSTSGFRIIREPLLSEFAREFPSYYLGDTFEATIAAARAGYQVVEIPAALTPRNHGKSTASSVRSIVLVAKVLTVTLLRLHPKIRILQKHVQRDSHDATGQKRIDSVS
jgi:glycosyltransferase involved in cell wall biosynthesis